MLLALVLSSAADTLPAAASSQDTSVTGAASLTVVLAFLVSFTLGLVTALLAMRNCFPFWTRATGTLQKASSFIATGEEVKMTLVVRKDLKMGTGKMAAQCAHAAVAVVEELCALQQQQRESQSKQGNKASALSEQQSLWVQWYQAWGISGCTKVALQCSDEPALREVLAAAKEKSLPHYLIRDAGRTQIAAGSVTVLAVGPAPKSLVDSVTGHLKLL